jgi:hypothetical protein
MGGSGFFKGEKKKPKKDKGKNNQQISISTAPTFTLPKVITGKKEEK